MHRLRVDRSRATANATAIQHAREVTKRKFKSRETSRVDRQVHAQERHEGRSLRRATVDFGNGPEECATETPETFKLRRRPRCDPLPRNDPRRERRRMPSSWSTAFPSRRGCGSRSWTRSRRQGRRCVAPDLYCLGDSDDPGPATFERNLEALGDLHAELDLGRVAVVVHDWGGFIGLAWACENPDLVSALVISDTGFFSDGKWHGMAEAMRSPQGEEIMAGIDRDGFAGLIRADGATSPRRTSTPTGARSPRDAAARRRSSSTARWTSKSSRRTTASSRELGRPDPPRLGRRRPVRAARRRAPVRARDPRRAARRVRGRRALRLRPGARADDARDLRLPGLAGGLVEELEQVVRGQLDLLVAPLRRAIDAGDQR